MTDVSPTDGFLLLAATILESLPSLGSVPDTALMQLHALFGPMLMSALQLVDKREVVRVTLPGGREVYQVTGSSGLPYSLYIDLPPPFIQPEEPPTNDDRPSSPTPSRQTHTSQTPISPTPLSSAAPSTPPSRMSSVMTGFSDMDSVVPTGDETGDAEIKSQRQLDERVKQHARAKRVQALARDIARLYCPCVGFMFNSLAGEKNHLCKHLLAAVIAHQAGKLVLTEVRFQGVVDLLGLRRDMAVDSLA